MGAVLFVEPDHYRVVGQIEEGQIINPAATTYGLGQDTLSVALRTPGIAWIMDPDEVDEGVDEWRQWLFKEKPTAFLTVPISVDRDAVGALVFVLQAVDMDDKPMIEALVTGYALYVGMTYGLLQAMQTDKPGARGQHRFLAKVEAKHAELEARNAELEAANKELEAKNAELQRFAYTVSHDLKTPLVTIQGFLSLLQEDTAQGDIENIARDISYISSAVDTMNRLLGELLDLSRVGRLMNPPETINVSTLAQEAAGLVVGPIPQSGITIEIDPALPPVQGDRVRLLEVYQNLIDNAVKFMGPQPAPHIEVGARRQEGEVVYYVCDNGIGIGPNYHEKIFGLFERLGTSREGSGIGLALVKRIVEVHGGRIWVESEEGQGSTFLFTLPGHAADEA